MKRTIFLHGYLADLHPEPLVVEADSVAEALRALSMIPALHREDGTPHLIDVDGITSDVALYSRSGPSEIHVRPRTGGEGGRNGLLQVLLGVVLIAVAVVFPAGFTLLGATIGTSSFFLTGALMALGGIMQMLMPVPENPGESPKNKYLGAPENTVQIGTRIPIVYGSRRVGGHYLSFDVDTVELAVDVPTNPESQVSVGGVATPLTPAEPDRSSYYIAYDQTPSTPIAPINPVYASAVTSALNTPISSWGVAA